MANSACPDPVLRQSTRVEAFAVRATQATYNLEKYETVIFKGYGFNMRTYFEQNVSMIPRFNSFYGMGGVYSFYSDSIKTYRKSVDMLEMMSADDPGFWVSNPQMPVEPPASASQLNHHAFHARTLKLWDDSIGLSNVAYYGNYSDSSGETAVDFLIKKLGE